MKKNKKGFTLVEVIIAMAVFAIMALLVCTLYAFLSRMIYKSNSMNIDVDSQVAKYENSDTDLYDNTDLNKTIIFGNGTPYGASVQVDIKTIDKNKSDPDNNPNIKYFYKP